MTAIRSSAAPAIRPDPRLRLVAETLETLLADAIAGMRRSSPAACRRDAVVAIEAGRAAGLLAPRPPRLSLCVPQAATDSD